MLLPFWLAVAAWGAAPSYDLPALPVRLALGGGSGLCRSAELRNELSYRFLRVVEPGDRAELTVRCAEGREGLTLTIEAGGVETTLTTDRAPGQDAHSAFLAGEALATDSDVIDGALAAFIRNNGDLADAGAQDYAAKDWAGTSAYMQRALESDVQPGPLHFALYAAEAGLGHPLQAKWHLAAFLKSSGKKAEDLTDKQALPLLDVQGSGVGEDPRPDEKYAAYRALADKHRWHEAFYALRELAAAAPWYEPAYRSMAKSLKAIGWKRLARLWDKRADFVATVNKDERLGRAIEARLDRIR